MTITFDLTDKQARAFEHRIPENGTPETFAAAIIINTAQVWAETDYITTSQQLVEALKDKPQAVLDTIIAQLSSIA